MIFIISVDGTHCRISEPRSEPSASWYSHKFNGPAVNYEIAICISTGTVVWVNGPFPAGSNPDLVVFRKPDGLRSKIPAGKKVIADNVYASEPLCSVSNPLDSEALKKFKARVKARQESFNNRIKAFNILSSRFRCNVPSTALEKHQAVFEAVCVLVQYEIGNGRPLFEL